MIGINMKRTWDHVPNNRLGVKVILLILLTLSVGRGIPGRRRLPRKEEGRVNYNFLKS
jgi:hypothetical protein